ncbi:MAG TPA: pyridoxal-dependent decarboxylase [Lacipirellulaceae bacterium]|jgi:L-2,4-diaminobutyrate decarboxylase|nr:pyridoxal-dependent decarboxylase [Lacipirellulaceae bacterium]
MTHSNADLAAARARIASAYSPKAFESVAGEIAATLADQLQAVETRRTKVLNWSDPATLVADARQCLETPKAVSANSANGSISAHAGALARDTLAHGQNMHHPHYVGHQVPAPVPLAGLFDLVGSVTNQVMAIYEMGPWATAVEHAVVDAIGERLGFAPQSFSGLVTSGGTLANLTGLLAARNTVLGDSWTAGVPRSGSAPVIVAHADAHYSVTRSAGILGMGTNQIVSAALDDRRRMDPNRLNDTLRDLRSRGVPIVAVSGAACATPIGAFDSIPEIVDVCRRHDVWLHIDAAHGGALAFSERHRHLVAGIEHADTVVCDAHKMMFMPALCALLFYRDPDHRLAPFHQEAPYLFDPLVPELAQYDSGVANLECTKRAAAFGVWGVWSLLGPQIFADMVDVTIDTARQFYEQLIQTDDFEPLHNPQCNIVAFRYLPAQLAAAAPQDVDQFQLRLRRRVIESGEFYLVGSRIDGRPVLRTTIMNPLTTPDDMRALINCLRRQGAELLAEKTPAPATR